MAANGEALTRLDQLTWEYVTLLQGPPSGTPECAALVKGMANEITVARRLDEGRKQFAQALHAAQAWPKTQTFRIETFASLSQYDAGKEAFAVSQVSPIVARGAWMAIAYSKGALPQAYPGPVADRCRVQFPAGLKPGSTMPASFALAFEGNEVLGVLPMPSSEAQAYLDSRTGREAGSRRVRIEALVEVGPAVLPPNAHMVAMLKVPATIVAARAVDPQSGAVLHVWR